VYLSSVKIFECLVWDKMFL